MATTRKFWNVWIEGDASRWVTEGSSQTEYEKGRAEIVAACGPSSGSGSGFDGWDVSYHNKTEKKAREIASKAAALTITKSVRVYQDDGPDEYIKGTK